MADAPTLRWKTMRAERRCPFQKGRGRCRRLVEGDPGRSQAEIPCLLLSGLSSFLLYLWQILLGPDSHSMPLLAQVLR